MSDKTVVMIEIVVTHVETTPEGQAMTGFRRTVTVKAKSPASPSFTTTQQMARTLGREAVSLVLDRDNMVVWTGEEDARLEPPPAALAGLYPETPKNREAPTEPKGPLP